MKKVGALLILIIITISSSFSQDSTFININKWLSDNNISIRKTFDGSKSENKPAELSFYENHKTDNDFLNINLGVKVSELELIRKRSSSLIFYPKFEWHKSTDSSDAKNKLDGGINFEFIPFGLKSSDLPNGVPNKGLKLAPWFKGLTSFKRNFIDNVFETKLAFQISLVSNYNLLPGCNIRDKKDNFRARYYPYIGVEYNRIPDLITKGQVEEFSTYLVRLFVEVWILTQTLQLNFDGTYREIINNKSTLRTAVPILSASIYFYPGKQESLGIGYVYKHGYDTDSKFQLVQQSSLKLSWKI
jgi:hypothetical protein